MGLNERLKGWVIRNRKLIFDLMVCSFFVTVLLGFCLYFSKSDFIGLYLISYTFLLSSLVFSVGYYGSLEKPKSKTIKWILFFVIIVAFSITITILFPRYYPGTHNDLRYIWMFLFLLLLQTICSGLATEYADFIDDKLKNLVKKNDVE